MNKSMCVNITIAEEKYFVSFEWNTVVRTIALNKGHWM